MVSTLAREYGDEIDFDGETYHAFPTPEQLATATEAELRELGLGYRAPYVVRTAEMVASGEDHPAEARDLPYEDAREYLTRFVGVGDKVADCVLLFSLDFDEAVPLDTWIKSAIEEYYPDCDRGTYADTSRALRERLGGEYARVRPDLRLSSPPDWRIGTLPNETPGTIFMNGLSLLPYGDRHSHRPPCIGGVHRHTGNPHQVLRDGSTDRGLRPGPGRRRGRTGEFYRYQRPLRRPRSSCLSRSSSIRSRSAAPRRSGSHSSSVSDS